MGPSQSGSPTDLKLGWVGEPDYGHPTCGAQGHQLACPGLWRLLETQTPLIESQKWNDILKAIQKAENTSICAAGRSATSPSPNLKVYTVSQQNGFLGAM